MSDRTNGKPADSQAKEYKPTKVELAKQASHHLRGTIAEVLHNIELEKFEHDDQQLLKFHGVYQQRDRDRRKSKEQAAPASPFSFMIRIAVPGGRCTSEQYLAIDQLAQKHANGTIRLTTRQAFQFHGVTKDELWKTMNGINEVLLTSLAACGDIPRNVMATPTPFADRVHREIQAMARDLAKTLAPASGAYHQIWVEGEKKFDSDKLKRENAGEEPFYGTDYLPRKFKIGVATQDDNSIDLYAYDAGLVAVTEGEGPDKRILGYNLLVGGGFGMTHNKPDTIARIADTVAFVEPEHAIEAMRQVVAVYRDNGNREDRKHARIKYLLEDWGVARFRDEVQARVEFKLHDPKPVPTPRQHDYLGVHEQGDGRYFLGVWVQNGRIQNKDGVNSMDAFRKIAEEVKPTFILSPMQSMLFGDLDDQQLKRTQEILAEHGVKPVEELSNVRRYSMACPAMPTCSLAMAESERVQPDIMDDLEAELEAHGLEDVELTVRMTGCPNGCARPYNADIGLVGRKPGVYHLFVGGGLGGDRMADLFAHDIQIETLRDTLRPLLKRFAAERIEDEGLSDFYRRAIAKDDPAPTIVTGKEEAAAEVYSLTVLA
ncbi:MAG: NADPH-dependent assimilatory sulfite reductase hemoprotein subunit [Planctomycetota bacterium]